MPRGTKDTRKVLDSKKSSEKLPSKRKAEHVGPVSMESGLGEVATQPSPRQSSTPKRRRGKESNQNYERTKNLNEIMRMSKSTNNNAQFISGTERSLARDINMSEGCITRSKAPCFVLAMAKFAGHREEGEETETVTTPIATPEKKSSKARRELSTSPVPSHEFGDGVDVDVDTSEYDEDGKDSSDEEDDTSSMDEAEVECDEIDQRREVGNMQEYMLENNKDNDKHDSCDGEIILNFQASKK